MMRNADSDVAIKVAFDHKCINGYSIFTKDLKWILDYFCEKDLIFCVNIYSLIIQMTAMDKEDRWSIQKIKRHKFFGNLGEKYPSINWEQYANMPDGTCFTNFDCSDTDYCDQDSGICIEASDNSERENLFSEEILSSDEEEDFYLRNSNDF
jgi:hypothetical protein